MHTVSSATVADVGIGIAAEEAGFASDLACVCVSSKEALAELIGNSYPMLIRLRRRLQCFPYSCTRVCVCVFWSVVLD